jgi:hypothetical protein
MSKPPSRIGTAAEGTSSRVTFLTLPIEIRHRIYRQLFCNHSGPLQLTRRRSPVSSFGRTEISFQTSLFCVNKQLYKDAATFAYGNNVFHIRDDFDILRLLGPVVRSSLRDLTIVPTMWGEETWAEIEMWEILGDCSSLDRVRIWMHTERLFPAIHHLRELQERCDSLQNPPAVALDLGVWEKHLTFDLDGPDYQRSRDLLWRGEGDISSAPPTRLTPREQLQRLPLHGGSITITSDVSPASARALDDHLTLVEPPFLVKSTLPTAGPGYHGRSERLCYQLVV